MCMALMRCLIVAHNIVEVKGRAGTITVSPEKSLTASESNSKLFPTRVSRVSLELKVSQLVIKLADHLPRGRLRGRLRRAVFGGRAKILLVWSLQ